MFRIRIENPLGFSMSTISSFKSIENKHDLYIGKDCMKKFCESLIEHAMKIINFIEKKNQVYIIKYISIINIIKLEIIAIVQRNIDVLHIAYVI